MTPLVSIIIPTYNRAHFISETLDSVLAQTYQNWECIVVDDGSTDNTENIIKAYVNKDSRFQFYRRPSTKPKGANACRNFGFELSLGDFVNWFDSDDVMHCDKLKSQIEKAIVNNANVVVSSHSITKKLEFLDDNTTKVFTSSDYYINYILGKHPVLTGEVMLSRNTVTDFKFDVKLHKAQEFDFFSRVFNQKLKYCITAKPLYYYRVSDDSISAQASSGNSKQVESLIYLSKKLQRIHSDNELIVKRAKRQGIKTYKSLVIKRKLKLVLKHINFFKTCYNMSTIIFVVYFLYSYTTKKGFDKMKSYN